MLHTEDSSSQQVVIGLAGDTMLGRLVNQSILVRGPRLLWGNLLPLLRSTDLNVINLESTFTHSTNPVSKVFNFKSDPANVRALQEARIGAVSLANNHIGDFDQQGMRDTITTLEGAGIAHAGAGMNSNEARAPRIIERNGMEIGLISATDNEPGWKAGKSSAGTNYFSIDHPEQLIKDVKALAPRVDIVIVSLHWGPNMRQRPPEQFVRLAHDLVDAGATIIHGHSAHIFQGVERYGKGIILYDTGDFVDDYRIDPKLRNDQSFFFLITATKAEGITDVRLIPTLISKMQVNRVAGPEGARIIKKMQQLSDEFVTTVTAENNGTARVAL